jgi:ATP adenylyltransferase
MNFEELKTFINDKMSMSHIYQHVLIKALIDSGGVSTTRNIGKEILKHDDSQVVVHQDQL